MRILSRGAIKQQIIQAVEVKSTMPSSREQAIENLNKADKVKAAKSKGRLRTGWVTAGVEGEVLRLGGVSEYFKDLRQRNPSKFDDMVMKHIVEKKETKTQHEIGKISKDLQKIIESITE